MSSWSGFAKPTQASPLVVGSADRSPDRREPADVRLMLVQFLGLVRAEEAVVPMLLAAQDEALSRDRPRRIWRSLGEIGRDGDRRGVERARHECART